MSHNEAIQWICNGAKCISITENDIPPTDGMISVFCCPPSNAATGNDRSDRRSPASRLSSGGNSGDNCLHILIADGVHTFYESIASKDIRHLVTEEGKELEKVTYILLHPDDQTFKVSYKREEGQLFGGSHDSKNTTSVRVSIRKTCMNSMVRRVWEGRLDNICHARYEDLPLFARNALPEEMNQTESSSGLSFSIMLGDKMNTLHKEVDSLRAKNKQLEANTLRWKSTTDKLSNQWETEKSELTDRFLTLFNEHKARHVETHKELDRLKGKKHCIERADETMSNRSSHSGTKRELLPDDEDLHDYASYDAEMVARLAAGPSSSRRCENDTKPRASLKQKRQNSLSQGSGFVNPHTGAMEFDNPQELFSSSEDDN